MGERGFEPLKAEPTGLQPVPFGHSGTPPGRVIVARPISEPTARAGLADARIFERPFGRTENGHSGTPPGRVIVARPISEPTARAGLADARIFGASFGRTGKWPLGNSPGRVSIVASCSWSALTCSSSAQGPQGRLPPTGSRGRVRRFSLPTRPRSRVTSPAGAG